MLEDLSFLVDETFSLAHNKSFVDDSECDLGPGLIYHLDANPSVFVIRSLAVKDLAESLKQCRDFPEHYPTLRLNHENINKLYFFKSSSYESAQKLNKSTAHRRFPVSEELMCSFSDPCFSYWLEATPKGFVISTKMPTSDIQNLVRLGDLGDFSSFKNLMSELLPILHSIPGSWKIFSQDYRIYFEGPESNFMWEILVKFFKEGDFSQEFIEAIHFLSARLAKDEHGINRLIASMKELSSLRSFWKKIFYQLNEAGSSRATLAM